MLLQPHGRSRFRHGGATIQDATIVAICYGCSRAPARLLRDVADLKRKLHRIIFQSRDKTIKGAGEYSYPRMLFFHETSHQGTGQFHTHLIVEKMPASLNTQYEMEALFRKRLPHKVKALSIWKLVDIQRINPDEPDYRRISSYLGKQTSLELIVLDPFNSDLSPQKK